MYELAIIKRNYVNSRPLKEYLYKHTMFWRTMSFAFFLNDYRARKKQGRGTEQCASNISRNYLKTGIVAEANKSSLFNAAITVASVARDGQSERSKGFLYF